MLTSIMYRLVKLRKSCLTDRQGAYIDIQLLEPNVIASFIYGGSSFGDKGLGHRVINEHLDPEFRIAHPSRHYLMMEHTDITPNFLAVCVFIQPTHFAIVILAESVYCLIFGCLQTPDYLAIRDSRLPKVEKASALNIADPFTTEDMSASRHAINEARRNELYQKTLEGGLFPVYKDPRKQSFQVNISSLELDIPVHIAHGLLLHVVAKPQVKVTFEVTLEPHPNAFAKKSIPLDDASRVAIKLCTLYSDSAFYLEKDKPSAIADANALFDFLTGKLDNISTRTPQQWGWDRYPFCGPYRQTVSRTT